MYLDEAEEIFDYWLDSPPTYQMVGLIAQMLGWEPSRRADNDDVSWQDVPELSPGQAAALGKMARVPPPVISLDAMREKNRQAALEIARRGAEKRA